MRVCSCRVHALRNASADSRQWVFVESKPSRSYHSVLPAEMPNAFAAATALSASARPWLRAAG